MKSANVKTKMPQMITENLREYVDWVFQEHVRELDNAPLKYKNYLKALIFGSDMQPVWTRLNEHSHSFAKGYLFFCAKGIVDIWQIKSKTREKQIRRLKMLADQADAMLNTVISGYEGKESRENLTGYLTEWDEVMQGVFGGLNSYLNVAQVLSEVSARARRKADWIYWRYLPNSELKSRKSQALYAERVAFTKGLLMFTTRNKSPSYDLVAETVQAIFNVDGVDSENVKKLAQSIRKGTVRDIKSSERSPPKRR